MAIAAHTPGASRGQPRYWDGNPRRPRLLHLRCCRLLLRISGRRRNRGGGIHCFVRAKRLLIPHSTQPGFPR